MNEHQRAVTKLATGLNSAQWTDEPGDWFEQLNEVDQMRREGSRITTAREIIQGMRSPKNDAALTWVLEWLYYRR